jgi:hypothetical protein
MTRYWSPVWLIFPIDGEKLWAILSEEKMVAGTGIVDSGKQLKPFNILTHQNLKDCKCREHTESPNHRRKPIQK